MDLNQPIPAAPPASDRDRDARRTAAEEQFGPLAVKAKQFQEEQRARERSETLVQAAHVLARLVAQGAFDPFTLIARLFLLADSTPPAEQPTGRCGTDPRTVLSAEDRAVVNAFQAYLKAKNSPEAGEQR
ncbi:hypothetical protein [Streptomyces odonnellii]|uniref:hypothetical protein n=1 Tax=Streptomyces odonnellii TaxID=1417980 RepID=UPI0006250B3F|nr:hypothetical protein [Streptomyces odonnellii]